MCIWKAQGGRQKLKMTRKLGIFARQLIWNRNKLPFNCVQSQSQSQFQFQFRTTQTLTASVPNTNKVSSFDIPERSHADYRRREEQRPNKPTGNFLLLFLSPQLSIAVSVAFDTQPV